MNEIRRIVSLFVGLIVVLLIVSYVFGKLGFYGKTTTSKTGGALAGLFGKKAATTPTPNASRKITIKQVVDGDTSTVKTVTTVPAKTVTTMNTSKPTNNTKSESKTVAATQPVASIPEAGAETAVLPILASALFGGVYLRRKI